MATPGGGHLCRDACGCFLPVDDDGAGAEAPRYAVGRSVSRNVFCRATITDEMSRWLTCGSVCY